MYRDARFWPVAWSLSERFVRASWADPFPTEIETLRKQPCRKLTKVPTHGRLSLQARWFIPLEMRVVSAKKEALQALSISKNVTWNALAFHFEEIEKAINSTRDTPMNQRIRSCQLGVAFCDLPKSSKLLHGIFPLVRGKAFLEIDPALY